MEYLMFHALFRTATSENAFIGIFYFAWNGAICQCVTKVTEEWILLFPETNADH